MALTKSTSLRSDAIARCLLAALSTVLMLDLGAGDAAAGDVVPTGSYNFSANGGNNPSQTPTMITITAKAKDGTTFQQTFTFGVATGPDSVRDSIRTAMNAAGWNVSNAGALGITILGHGNSPITEVDGGEKPTDATLRYLIVSEDSSQDVKQGTVVVGQPYKFAFLDLPNSTSLDQNGVLAIVLNTQTYSTNVSAGETPSQLTSDLYNTLISNGVPASLTGGMVAVQYDASHNLVTSTDLSLTSSGLETQISIPILTTVPEPDALVLASLGMLAIVGSYWQCRRRGG